MMMPIRNDRGIALVTTLMLTLISLGVILALLYMITQGTKSSSVQKRYRTATEASYGGTELLAKTIVPFLLQNGGDPPLTLAGKLGSEFSSLGLQVRDTTGKCLQEKVTKGTGAWSSACDPPGPAAKAFDLKLKLPAESGDPFVVYAKITDTQTGNTDTGGLALEGAGVAEGSNVIVPEHKPYLYTIEVQGQREGDRTVSSDLEVVYAY